MLLRPENICDLKCFESRESFEFQLSQVKQNKADSIMTVYESNEYSLQYAPVGNYPAEPLTIICGKTTSGDSHDLFISTLKQGRSFHEACLSSIYSNMRHNLFVYLQKIGLFDYLKNKSEYWSTGDYWFLWHRIFTDLDSSLSSGIQVTQACNCAILSRLGNRSSEPKKKAFIDIQNRYGCLFKHLRVTNKLRLIVFLDTPSNRKRRFHQSHYWHKWYEELFPAVKVISITHPSSRNSDIYNNLENWDKIGLSRRKRARELFLEAKSTIASLT